MAEDRMHEEVYDAVSKSGYTDLSPENVEMLETFAREVALWSVKIHLVGRGSIEKNVRLLILDSLLLLKTGEGLGIVPRVGEVPARQYIGVADIGAGAGFPGLVWKIARPDLRVTLFERKERAHAFLERIIAALGLVGAEALLEDAGKHERERFSIVTSKAAGRLATLLPLAEMLLADGGSYMTIKGGAWRKELAGASQAGMSLLAAVELPERRGAALCFRKASIDDTERTGRSPR